jgi:hypothetical protein
MIDRDEIRIQRQEKNIRHLLEKPMTPCPKPINNWLIKPGDIPYKNRWKQWVFRNPSQRADMNWPGFKNSKGWKPVLINGKWEWEVDE